MTGKEAIWVDIHNKHIFTPHDIYLYIYHTHVYTYLSIIRHVFMSYKYTPKYMSYNVQIYTCVWYMYKYLYISHISVHIYLMHIWHTSVHYTTCIYAYMTYICTPYDMYLCIYDIYLYTIWHLFMHIWHICVYKSVNYITCFYGPIEHMYISPLWIDRWVGDMSSTSLVR